MPISCDKNSKLALVADIGGTQMRAGLIDTAGNVLKKEIALSEHVLGFELAKERLANLMLSVVGDTTVAGVGIASAGPIVPETGKYWFPPSLGTWHGYSFKPILEERLGQPVKFGHDATLAALAETKFGKHKGLQHFVYVTISTGIGGGIITNGEMVTGKEGFAGEIGHFAVKPGSGLRCNVNCDGCFEAMASGSGITNLLNMRIKEDTKTAIKTKLAGDMSKADAKTLFTCAVEGDPVAKAISDEVIDYIGIGISSLLNTFDPEMLTVGGGVMQSLEVRWEDILEVTKKRALPRFRDAIPVQMTEFGDDICMIGAAALVFGPRTT